MGHSEQIGRLAIAVSLGLALLTGGASGAAAQTVAFEIADGTRVSMQVPKGYCHFDPNGHEADRKYVAVSAEGLSPDNKLLAAFADCAAVNAARAAWPNGPYPTLERWVQILAPLADQQARRLEGVTRTQVLEMLAKLEAADRSVSLSHAVRELELARSDAVAPKPIGLLARDQETLISGMLARQDEDGNKRLVAGVVGMTMVGSYVVSVNTFTHYTRRGTFDALVAETKDIVGDLIGRNEKK